MLLSRIPHWARFLMPVAAAHLGLALLAPSPLPDTPAAVLGRSGEFTIQFSVERPATRPPTPEPPPTGPVEESVGLTTRPPVKVSESSVAIRTAKPPRRRRAPLQHAATEVETQAKTSDSVSSHAGDFSSFVAPSADADYLDNPRPRYPKASIRRRETGTVMLSLIVTPDGTARDVRIIRSSGHPLLDKAALEAVCSWRFVPAKRMGQPVEAACEIPIHFKLKQ